MTMIPNTEPVKTNRAVNLNRVHEVYLQDKDTPLQPRFAGACPDCGDSLQTVRTAAPDHGDRRLLLIAWCMDCLDVKDHVVPAVDISP